LIASVLAAGGTSSDESQMAMTEIHFCHYRVPDHVKEMNSSFSIVYLFQVADHGRLIRPKKLHDPFLASI
jgi:hypothetical protein